MKRELIETMCPICHIRDWKIWVEPWEKYSIYRCSNCEGEFTQTDNTSSYYEKAYKFGGNIMEDSYKLGICVSPEENIKDALRASPEYKYALQFLKNTHAHKEDKLLDLGCGNGVFAKLAEETGIEIYALDSSDEAIKYANEKFGLLNTFVGSVDNVPSSWSGFNFITCFQILEHIQDPSNFVEKIHKLLAPGGYLIMSVPNKERLAVKLRRREGWDYPPHHITRWSRHTINILLEAAGFINISVTISDITRSGLGFIFLPAKIHHQIVKQRLNAAIPVAQGSEDSFISSKMWSLFINSADTFVRLLDYTIGNIYGETLVCFGEKA